VYADGRTGHGRSTHREPPASSSETPRPGSQHDVVSPNEHSRLYLSRAARTRFALTCTAACHGSLRWSGPGAAQLR
jgi:hypothetical protein